MLVQEQYLGLPLGGDNQFQISFCLNFQIKKTVWKKFEHMVKEWNACGNGMSTGAINHQPY